MSATVPKLWPGLLTFDWRREDLFVCPPVSQTSPNRILGYAKTLGPVGDAQRDAIGCQQTIAGRVSRLFFLCRPSAIVWLVITIIIDAFNGLTGRTISHIGSEQNEVFPSLTDRNASASVTVEMGVSSIRATAQHASPDSIGSGDVTISGLTVPDRWSRSDGFALEASTTARDAAGQGRRSDADRSAADTDALPEHATVYGSLLALAQGGESAKELACQILSVWVQRIHFVVKKSIGDESTILLTSSATEMPRRFACFLSNAICGSVNEIISLVISCSVHFLRFGIEKIAQPPTGYTRFRISHRTDQGPVVDRPFKSRPWRVARCPMEPITRFFRHSLALFHRQTVRSVKRFAIYDRLMQPLVVSGDTGAQSLVMLKDVVGAGRIFRQWRRIKATAPLATINRHLLVLSNIFNPVFRLLERGIRTAVHVPQVCRRVSVVDEQRTNIIERITNAHLAAIPKCPNELHIALNAINVGHLLERFQVRHRLEYFRIIRHFDLSTASIPEGIQSWQR